VELVAKLLVIAQFQWLLFCITLEVPGSLSQWWVPFCPVRKDAPGFEMLSSILCDYLGLLGKFFSASDESKSNDTRLTEVCWKASTYHVKPVKDRLRIWWRRCFLWLEI